MINTFSFGSYILVYNGQIYNTKELSETLKENGFTLNSHSDTEVLLKKLMVRVFFLDLEFLFAVLLILHK